MKHLMFMEFPESHMAKIMEVKGWRWAKDLPPAPPPALTRPVRREVESSDDDFDFDEGW